MGARKKSAPRHGSLGVRPRKRASRIVPRVRSWPKVECEQPILLGFLAYKAGMTHAIIVDDNPHSYTSGKEIMVPVTVLEAPPLLVLGVRGYTYHVSTGLRSVGEVWRDPLETLEKLAEEFSNNPFVGRSVEAIVRQYYRGLRKKLPCIVKEDKSLKYGYKFLEGDWESKLDRLLSRRLVDVRAIVSTIPVVTGVGKKKPEILEIKIGGGELGDRIEYARKILGSAVYVSDTFKEGQFIDIIGVTKGKGFQGVIKRFGVKELPRWHKHRKGSRRIGARSPGFGTISPVPQAGQMGFHRRTEYNKRIIKIGFNGLEATPSGGFLGYGIVKTHYILVQGSVIGPRKRTLVLRHPIRPPEWKPDSPPQIIYLSLTSKQGV